MREVAFVRRHADRWERFETLLREDDPDPDTLADLYVELTDDLAYARTYYPDSDTTEYLNELAREVHQSIYRERREEKGRFARFWTHEVPEAMAEARTELLVSVLVFGLAVLVGALSATHDDAFARLILGDRYVNMTISNIESGDPMAVYKQSTQLNMFLGIAANNVRVSFYAFVMGVFASLGTAWVLVQNGIMLGTFHALFAKYGVLTKSLLVVYIHGALEICAIVIAGAAGITFGRGLLFPKTYTRRTAFVQGAKRGAKIIIGLVPVFIVAAFLEGFVTRYTEMPVALSLIIIVGSLAFILWYFVVRPMRLYPASRLS